MIRTAAQRTAAEKHFESDAQSAPDPIGETARAAFGIPYLYPYQRLVVSNTLEGCSDRGESEIDRLDQLVILPTGAGKSLCFQLPAAMMSGITLVLYPLLSLMNDQARRLRAGSVAVRMLRGGQSKEERREIFSCLHRESRSFLIANPEVLLAESVLSALGSLRIAHIVIDEAHCVAEWGETFRPAYLEVGRIIRALEPRVVTGFTATASPPVLAKISTHIFGSRTPRLIQGNPDRPNIRYSVVKTFSVSECLVLLLSNNSNAGAGVRRPAIVFCRSRTETELRAAFLRDALTDANVRFYHAGLSKIEKEKIEQWFFDSRQGILCATTAYGMGVDKKDIRTVIHTAPPPSVEAYLQESGRGGRDGESADALLLNTPVDAPGGARRRRNKPGPAGEASQEREALMRSYVRTPSCRREFLLRAMGSEAEVCTGCDRCRGERLLIGNAHLRLIAVLRDLGEPMSRSDLIDVLAGRRYRRLARFAPCSGHGVRSPEAFREALESLLSLGALCARRRGRVALHRPTQRPRKLDMEAGD
jgi:ATP-dependent DNA helicase RecQ